ncbi:AAA family ATPase [Duganella sp. FT92W]|uniref:AAA family ATPase n=1 Tax=Pseudoduganella rivuli TaxID=2666085 RepID=A0A7X2LV99_9BURK|nr:AAA family ATPase [Pseudoduganella rivuli]MRV75241.1 AAA family ATPase [Pseudoduganella rivuli]
MDTHPQLVVVGGPNGSGKSTFARSYAEKVGIPYLGADDIAFELSPADPFTVRVAAGREFSRRLSHALASRQSLVIESTLAGASLARSLAKARTTGYETTSILVFLDSEELCLRRISERVAQGGHDVPEADVRRRFRRVFPVFWQHYRPLSDRSLIVFNGGESFLIVAESENDNWEIYDANMWAKFSALTEEVSHED